MSERKDNIKVEERPHSGLWEMIGVSPNEAVATDQKTGKQYSGFGDSSSKGMAKAVKEAVGKLQADRAASKKK